MNGEQREKYLTMVGGEVLPTNLARLHELAERNLRRVSPAAYLGLGDMAVLVTLADFLLVPEQNEPSVVQQMDEKFFPEGFPEKEEKQGVTQRPDLTPPAIPYNAPSKNDPVKQQEKPREKTREK